MTIAHARKLLGILAVNLTDEQIQLELNATEFLVELVLMQYEKQKGDYNGKRNA